MATAVLRRPLLASLLPAATAAGSASCSSSYIPSCLHLRRRRSPRPVLAVSSDSSKPLASSSTGGGGDPDEEPVLPLLQELADCLVLPPKFLSRLPRDLRLDSLKVVLLVLGYTSTALSVAAAVGLVVLAQQINPEEDKSN